MSLLLSVLTALWLVGLHVLLRAAGCRWVLAALAVGTVLVVYVFSSVYGYVSAPSGGVIRFGPPYVALGLALAAARSEGARRSMLVAATLAALALAGAWSLEAAVWSGFGVAALAAVATWQEVPRRPRRAALAAVIALAVPAAGAAAFLLLTWAVSGKAPQVRPYVQMFTAQSADVGALPIAPWSPGLLTAGFYALSAGGVVAWLARGPLARGEGALVAGAAGLTAFGVVAYPYFLWRSAPLSVPPVSVPALLAAALWAELALRRGAVSFRRCVSGVAVGVAALAVLGASGKIREQLHWSALAALAPGASGQARLLPAVDRLLDNPPQIPEAGPLGRFVRRLAAGRPLIVLLEQQLSVEVLLRSGRGNHVPLGNPEQDLQSPLLVRRIVAAAARAPRGTVVVAPLGPGGRPSPRTLGPLDRRVLAVLRRRPLVLLAAHRSAAAQSRAGAWLLR